MEWVNLAKWEVKRSIPDDYQGARMKDFEFKFQPDPSLHGICLRGRTGTGKTHLACACAIARLNPSHPNSITTLRDHGFPIVGSIRFWSAPTLMSRIRSTFNKVTATETEYEILQEMIEPKILILDDLGAQSASDFSASTMYAIIAERRNRRKDTYVTTNKPLSEIHDWEPRIASRLAEFATIELPDIDRRVKKKRQ